LTKHAVWCLIGLASIVGPVRPQAPSTPLIAFNDNRVPAGVLTRGVLTVSLVAQAGEWKPYGADGGSIALFAFGEEGKPLQDPGPLLRVPQGTRIHARVRNLTGKTLVVHGLAARRVAVMDSLVIASGATGEASFVTDAAGTFYYWGSMGGEGFEDRMGEDGRLNGALIVDPAGPAPRPDRVFVIERWMPDTDFWHDVFTVNGRPWPYSERLTYDMGDSIRWRVINASNDVHPLHLHGFYYRVDARGDFAQDTIYWPAQRRMDVTEPVWDGTTMDMVWHADRPGNWIFHCHLNYHVPPNAALAPDTEPTPDRIRHMMGGYPEEHPMDHARYGMGGLVMGITIRQPATWHAYDGPRRTLRLLVQSDSGPGDSTRHFGYVLGDGTQAPATAPLRAPGPAIVLQRGEPTRIWVVNHSPAMTQVHWHGLEIESYYDGVTGFSGAGTQVEPATMPGDSFEVLVTPPRAGTFIYHTHINDIYQQAHGLYGPLIVLDSGTTWNPDRDRVFIVGDNAAYDPVLNGGRLDPITLTTGVPYRFRLINITAGSPGAEFWLVRAGAPVRWRPIAKDGYALPPGQADPRVARQTVSIGETYDFRVQAHDTGSATLELRRRNGSLIASQPIRFGRP
jgi:FtsP/CotA-like multicopper oxidase with cupredoxin domain